MDIINWNWFLNSGGGSPAFNPATYFADNLVLFYDASNLRSLLQEQAVSAVPITAVSANADKVGTLYDLGKHGYYSTAPSTATRPALGGDSENASYFDFTRSASNRLQVINSASYLRTIHSSTAIFSVSTRYKKKQDGIVELLCASQASTTAQSGIYLAITAANKIQVFITYSSAGLNRCNYTSTATFTVADGWKDIIVTISGTSGRLIIGDTVESFSVNATGATGAATSDLIIGSTTAGATTLDGYMTHFMITNTALSDDDIALIKDWHPTRGSRSWSNTIFTFDFSNTAKGWADVAKTTPISNGVAFRAWEPSETSIFGPLNRDLTTASSGVSPIYNPNLENGIGGCTWDGVDDNVDLTDAIFREGGGIGGFLVVYKNTDALLGSHLFSGAGYFVATGSAYPSGALGLGVTYTTLHPSGGVPGLGPLVQKNNGELTNVTVVVRDKTEWAETNGALTTILATAPEQSILYDMGTPIIAGWNLQGNIMKIIYWRGLKTQAEVDAMISAENTTYAI